VTLRGCFNVASIAATAALLAGCGAQNSMPSVAQNPNLAPAAQLHSRLFRYIGGKQRFKVPAGVTEITIIASGASGSAYDSYNTSGVGGWVRATIPVTPGENLGIYVGGEGGYGYNYGLGGYNGGGGGNSGYCSSGEDCGNGGGGGGASDVRQGGNALANRVIVAGGGGGQGCCGGGGGGAGGGHIGAAGADGGGYQHGFGGGGATQHRGGNAGQGGGAGLCFGDNGAAGSLGQGGHGGDGCYGGGGGGGGFYGAGGGGGGAVYDSSFYGGSGGGGGGGSSYVEPRATRVEDRHGGAKPGNGKILISWFAANSNAGASPTPARTRKGTLIYVSAEIGGIGVYSYPTMKLVETLALQQYQTAEGLCSDAGGDVFATLSYPDGIYEYAHGGSEPIEELSDDYGPAACAVDPTTGNLAVANSFGSSGEKIAIYPDAQGSPTYYSLDTGYPLYCTYDDAGDLFASGYGSEDVQLFELPAGGESFTSIGLPQGVYPAAVQWNDGELVASLGSQYPVDVWRLKIYASSASLVGTTSLQNPTGRAPGWVQFAIQNNKIIMPAGTNQGILGMWNYPRGGVPARYIRTPNGGYGVAISAAP
jgi:hypothetical protein